MRIRKSLLLVLLLSFALTGCYTQLEYSQKMNKVTDDKSDSEYAWSDDTDEKANLTEADSIYIAETYGAKVATHREGENNGTGEYDGYEDEEYIPVHYKDYDVVETYEACGCDPYKTYNIYNSYYPSSFYTGYEYYYDRFHYGPSYYAFGSPYYHYRPHFGLGFSYLHRGYGLSFFYGHPYSFYDPFFYDPFFYGYRSPIFHNNFFFGSRFAGTVRTVEPDRRNGRRSIGTGRVGSRDRNTTGVRTRSDITRDKATGRTVRSRGNSVQRTRGTVESSRRSSTRSQGTTRVGSSSKTRSDAGTKSRGTVKRSRSGNDGSGTKTRSRTRVRNNDDKREQAINSRSRLGVNRNIALPDHNSRAQLESRIRQQRVKIDNRSNQNTRSRRSLLGNFRKVFKSSGFIHSVGSRSSNGRSSRGTTIRTRSSNSRSSSSGTKVTRSRSSSKSSGTRSRSSSSRGSSSNRDRNN